MCRWREEEKEGEACRGAWRQRLNMTFLSFNMATL